ncbi:MAG: DUF1552 domain-containing protein [Planctomycetales bacterium]
MLRAKRIPRRTFLRGLGTAVALPALECMARSVPMANAAQAAEAAGPPCRMAVICVPYGVNHGTWDPAEEGTGFKLPDALSPLSEHTFQVLTGLSHSSVWGAHRTETPAFLTGTNILSGTPGYSWRNAVSMDQIAAERIGPQTRFPSLELSRSGGTIAYNRMGTPLAGERLPGKVFDRLFLNLKAADQAQEAAYLRKTKSILDLVRDDHQRLDSRVGRTDREILDQYATSIREVESRLTRQEEWLDRPKPAIDAKRPGDGGLDRGAHIRTMADLMVLAFQTDSTRIITYAVGNDSGPIEGSGVREGHHGVSHHGGIPETLEKVSLIDRWHVAQLAYFLDKLKATPDLGGTTLFDNSLVLFGSGMGDGNVHDHRNLPILLAGGGCGKLKQRTHRRYPENTPLANLYVSMLHLMGVPAPSFADSTGPLPLV